MSGWIKVEERLPFYEGKMLLAFQYKKKYYVDIGWYDQEEDEWGIEDICISFKVIAWQPLPEYP